MQYAIQKRKTLRNQVEYYFSDENYPRDIYIHRHQESNNGFLPLSVLLEFPLISQQTQSLFDLQNALRFSKFLILSSDKKGVTRRCLYSCRASRLHNANVVVNAAATAAAGAAGAAGADEVSDIDINVYGLHEIIKYLENRARLHDARRAKAILIGSQALALHVGSDKFTRDHRMPQDWDVIANPEFVIEWLRTMWGVVDNDDDIHLTIYSPGSGASRAIGEASGSRTKTKNAKLHLRDGKISLEMKFSYTEENFRCYKKKYKPKRTTKQRDFRQKDEKTSNELLLEYCLKNDLKDGNDNANDKVMQRLFSIYSIKVAPIEILYALKTATIFWPIHWIKTMEDIQFMQNKFLPEILSKGHSDTNRIVVQMRKELEFRLPHPPVNLEMTNESFFAKSEQKLQRKFKHDDLHKIVAFEPGKPAFEKFKVDPLKAKLSKRLFEECRNRELKLQLVQEEIMALALERFVIPNSNRALSQHPQRAYLRAYELLCTRLSKGWFREFALQQYATLKFLPRSDLGLMVQPNNCQDSKDNDLEEETDIYFEQVEQDFFRLKHYLSWVVPLEEVLLRLIDEYARDLPENRSQQPRKKAIRMPRRSWSCSDSESDSFSFY